MHPQEMMQHVKQCQHMAAVIARLAGADVIDDHVADFFRAMLLAGKILGKRRGGDFGYVLVLGDRQHFLFAKAAQGQAILEGDHSTMRFCTCLAADAFDGAAVDG